MAKTGGGLLGLTGVNTYTGSTSVAGGTLQVGNGAIGSLATAGITLSSNTLLAYDIGTAQTISAAHCGRRRGLPHGQRCADAYLTELEVFRRD